MQTSVVRLECDMKLMWVASLWDSNFFKNITELDMIAIINSSHNGMQQNLQTRKTNTQNEWMFNDTPAQKTDRQLGVRNKHRLVLWNPYISIKLPLQSR